MDLDYTTSATSAGDDLDDFFRSIMDPRLWERPPEPTRIIWSGLTGKTGRAALQAARARSDVEIVGGISRRTPDELASLNIGGETFPGIRWHSYDLLEFIFHERGPFDVIVDFSHASRARVIAEIAAAMGKPLISGTAGLTDADLDVFRDYGGCVPVFRGGNFQFRVKSFIDRAVAWGIEHPGEGIMEESFYKGKVIPSQTFAVIRERIYQATGHLIDVQSLTPHPPSSLICDWRFGGLHCRTVGFEDLANNILDIAKVMKGKPAKHGALYDLDEIWPELPTSV